LSASFIAHAAGAIGQQLTTWQILGGIADTVAQTLTAVRERANRKGGAGKDDFLAIEIHELDRRNPWPDHDIIPDSKKLPPPFDFERTIRFMSYGFLMSPIQHRWFGFLSSTFPITKIGSPWIPALKRVAFDQFLFAPAGLAAFFTYMTIAEGGGKRAVQRKFQDVYVPALKANFLIWPTVQIINFRIMPIQFQIVRRLTFSVRSLLTLCSALCFHHRYRLDSISLPDQLCRGGLDIAHLERLPLYMYPWFAYGWVMVMVAASWDTLELLL
jgi:hypothetical protein